MKKWICILLVQLTMFVGSFSQMATHDATLNFNFLTEMMTSLDELYTLYDHTMNQIEMIQQNYERMQFYIDRAATWDFDEIEWDGDLDFRNEIMDATSQIDKQLSNIRNIKNSLTAKTVSFGGKSFSFASLCGVDQGEDFGNLWDFVKDGATFYADGFEEACAVFAQGVPEDEAQWLWAKYGLTPANYQMVREVEKELDKKAAFLFGNADEQLKQQNNNYKQWYSKQQEILKMLDADGATDGELLQAQGLLLNQTCFTMNQMREELAEGMSYIAWYNRWKDQKQESEEKSRQERLEKAEQNSISDYF